MCAIVDANVQNEVFGENSPPAGQEFLSRIIGGQIQLVLGGGKLRSESTNQRFQEWAREAALAGQLIVYSDEHVNAQTEDLLSSGTCRSNDVHIIALAQISGARLLYSNDKDLHNDFKNPDLISAPRGKIYSTLSSAEYSSNHKNLLDNRRLCASRK